MKSRVDTLRLSNDLCVFIYRDCRDRSGKSDQKWLRHLTNYWTASIEVIAEELGELGTHTILCGQKHSESESLGLVIIRACSLIKEDGEWL